MKVSTPVAAMAVPTFLIGLLPGYETLGLLAPVALVLLRMVQRLSVGGEYNSSMVFLVERASVGHRGLMGAVVCCGTTLGILLGSGVGATIAATMATETLDTWGWRIPFLLGIIVGIVGFILRRHVAETAPVKRSELSPIVETLRYHWQLVERLAALSVFNAVSFYAMFVYVASWLQTADGISPAHALEINNQHDDPAAGAAGLRLSVGPLRSQTHSDAVNRARGHCRPAAILGHVSPFPGADPARTNGLRFDYWPV
jgi:MHS family proline/betaine transporter-like MFS transporter